MIGSQKSVPRPSNGTSPTTILLSGLKADFVKFCPVLTCSRCQNTGKMVSNGSATSTGSPQFKCRCGAHYNASSMQALINGVQHKIPEVLASSRPSSPAVPVQDDSVSMDDVGQCHGRCPAGNSRLKEALSAAEATIARLSQASLTFPRCSCIQKPSYASAAAKSSPKPRRKAPTAKAIAAVVRGMTIREDEDPGFQICPRQRLRKLKIDNARVLDLTTLTEGYGGDTQNFDPLDPVHLRDPALATLSLRTVPLSLHVHNERMLRAIGFIRAPVKFAVARSCCEQGWISEEQLLEILPPRRTQPNPDLSIHTASTPSHSFSDL
ncbi:hypothetical protein CLU79DRAFT_841413 [Phycomyces nitens]|nr:hypothetical protein CLU79DRAFT_841413 [Phycomyces nitens]